MKNLCAKLFSLILIAGALLALYSCDGGGDPCEHVDDNADGVSFENAYTQFKVIDVLPGSFSLETWQFDFICYKIACGDF